jgi:hypothetical protein
MERRFNIAPEPPRASKSRAKPGVSKDGAAPRLRAGPSFEPPDYDQDYDPGGGWRRPLRRAAVKPAAAFIGVTLGVTVLRRQGDANWGLPFSPRIARRGAALIPAAFVPASFASSRIGAPSRRGTERFGHHDLTAAPRRRELGLPFSPRIARRGASPIPAPFVPASFALVPDRGAEPPRGGTLWRPWPGCGAPAKRIGIAFRVANRPARRVADSGSICARFLRPVPDRGAEAPRDGTLWRPWLDVGRPLRQTRGCARESATR